MYGSKSINKKNYRSLVIAGIGTIGKSLISLGADQLSLFQYVYATDKNPNCLIPVQGDDIICQAGDISEPQFLNTLLAEIPSPFLFVNLCSGTNNVKIRNSLNQYEAAYLDSCASITDDPEEYRFSRLMPYTYKDFGGRFPHWLCWGINPGMVEIVARRILADLPDMSGAYNVAVYEFDRLENRKVSEKAAVGWCPEALVEEIMLSPTLEIKNGRPLESSGTGTRKCLVNWDGSPVTTRIVGHEDIWNLAEIPAVKNAGFYYSLCSRIMNILDKDDAAEARSMLGIPGSDAAITGLEQVAVQVTAEHLEKPHTLIWTEDHAATWRNYGVNGVQYQTAKSLLLAIMLLQCTDYGLKAMTCNASNLPITNDDWLIIELFMKELDIRWQDGSHLNLRVLEKNCEKFAA